ncbi:MAG: hypothetical protein ACJ74U_16745 [Jatrophihabitantaceae bacterium]
MTRQLEILQRRFGEARPGLQLIAVETGAIPVTTLRADVLAQEKKEIPIAEEFTLRFVSLGIDTPDAIATYLGLDSAHILDAAATQIAENHLERRGASARLGLTTLGTEVARDLAATRPVLRQLPLVFDRLIWALADYADRALISKKEAQEAGMVILPPLQNSHIGIDDVSPADVNALIKDDRVQVLRVHKVSFSKHRFLPVQLLVYADTNRREIELALCIDDNLAVEHAVALEKVGAVGRLGLSLGEPTPRPILEVELENQRQAEVVVAPGTDESGESPPATTSAAPVRSVGVFEHPDLLAEALDGTKRRLLIISPWVKNAVVTTEFVSKLEQRIRSGVDVTIAHGYGDDDSGSDESAVRRLRNLAARFPQKFSFVRVKNTHAKILIYDDSWVSTSFNWLSFRGDPERTYRMEEGTLVRIPARVEKEYLRYLDLVSQQRAEG